MVNFITTLIAILLIPWAVKSQEKEHFIKYNEAYIKSLGEENDINENLEESTFKERFDFLNQNIPLPIDYNEVTYVYAKNFYLINGMEE